MDIRVVDFDGEPWFVAADVCKALDLKLHHKGSVGYHLKKLNNDEITPCSEVGVKLPGRGMTYAKLISESGLYKLIMRSDKPQARSFQDWVTKVVLPTIRKTGSYYVAGEEGQSDWFSYPPSPESR